jgi:hypothetical protein
MSDDEQLVRLTALARRVWPELGAEVRWDALYDIAKVVNYRSVILYESQHPRGLEALEAALRVLAGEESQAEREAAFYQALAKQNARAERDAEKCVAALEDKLMRVRAALVEHSPSKALDILDGDDGIDRLIARSSLGEATRRMKTDPEAELQRIDDELTPEVMDAIRDANAMPPAWVEALASDWESSYRMLRKNYPEHAGLTLIANCLRDLAAELRRRAKED